MNSQRRPAWYEGMTLDPHHFQQWDRHQQYVINARTRSTTYFDWGFTALDIDREALANGKFSLRECSGVSRDGLVFNCPHIDPLPRSQAFKDHFAPTSERLGVYLAIPLERERGVNCQLFETDAGRVSRFSTDTVSLSDDNTGANERNVSVCQPNLYILFEGDPNEEFSVMHVADVVRASDGSYQLSAKHVAPSLSLSASENLMKTARRIVELLMAKASALGERRRQQPTGQIEYTTIDVTLLGILQTVNSFLPLLNYHHNLGKCHPETLYSILLSLAGQLTTYSPDFEMRTTDLPLYDHASSSECFSALESRIALLLDTVLSSNFVHISLSKQSESQWTATIPDHNLLATAQFYLAASGDIPERKVMDELKAKVKIGSPEDVPTLVAAALPGLEITFTARPPTGLPSRPGLQYFRLEKSGRFWDAIARTNTLAMFVPADFRGLKCELFAVKS